MVWYFAKWKFWEGISVYSLCLHKKGEFDLNYDYAGLLKPLFAYGMVWCCCWRFGLSFVAVAFSFGCRSCDSCFSSNVDVNLGRTTAIANLMEVIYIGTLYLISNLKNAKMTFSFQVVARMNGYRGYWLFFVRLTNIKGMFVAWNFGVNG